MRVLIVEGDQALSRVWKRHLERHGASVMLAASQSAAVERLQENPVNVIVLSLDLSEGSAFAVADFASYRHPEARVVFVTRSTFFSDGSIFQLIPNTAAYIASETPPEDLAAIVEHHGHASPI
ncbi:MAG: response regulator [Pseudomonadota bacterium]